MTTSTDDCVPEAFYLAGAGTPGCGPIVFDSPHSWSAWPHEAPAIQAPMSALLSSWDAWVDELWARACDGRAPVLAARFNRAYIDANRAIDDIDQSLLATPWPGEINPAATSERGMGLVRRLAQPGAPLYAKPLTIQDVQGRIEKYYEPYHRRVAELIAQARAKFDLTCHFNCHSMKSVGNAMNLDSGMTRPDMVVSDYDGTSADSVLVKWVVSLLRSLGYKVQVNDPYRGAELIRRHGKPNTGCHSIQIEINRALYMDEVLFRRHEGFNTLAGNLSKFVAELDDGLRTNLRRMHHRALD